MKTNLVIGVVGSAALGLMVAVSPRLQTAQLPYSECIGEAYGSAGCPLLSDESTPPNCGDAILDEGSGEECDEGRFNGVSFCSDECKIFYCGDAEVQNHIGEECDLGVNVYAVSQ